MTVENTRDYAAATQVIADTIEEIGGKALTRSQKLAMMGSVALLLSNEFKAGFNAGQKSKETK